MANFETIDIYFYFSYNNRKKFYEVFIMRKIKIVTDSSSDLLSLNGISFESVPLTINTSEKEYVDNANLDVLEMVKDLREYTGKSGTACPSTGMW